MPSNSEVTYTVGQGAAAHRTLGISTAESCAAYLLPHLKSTPLKLLDVGCGPGSITADFAQILTIPNDSCILLKPPLSSLRSPACT